MKVSIFKHPLISYSVRLFKNQTIFLVPPGNRTNEDERKSIEPGRCFKSTSNNWFYISMNVYNAFKWLLILSYRSSYRQAHAKHRASSLDLVADASLAYWFYLPVGIVKFIIKNPSIRNTQVLNDEYNSSKIGKVLQILSPILVATVASICILRVLP